MGIKTAYTGYKAYEYLVPGQDYQEFALSPKDRVPEYLYPLSPEQEKKALAIAKEKICISMHEHPVYNPLDLNEYRTLRYYAAVNQYNTLVGSWIDETDVQWKDGFDKLDIPALLKK